MGRTKLEYDARSVYTAVSLPATHLLTVINFVFDVCLDQQEEVPSESPAAAPKHTWSMFLALWLRFMEANWFIYNGRSHT